MPVRPERLLLPCREAEAMTREECNLRIGERCWNASLPILRTASASAFELQVSPGGVLTTTTMA